MPKASYCISISRPAFFEQTLESVLSQTLGDIEILISDIGDLRGRPIFNDYGMDKRLRKIPRKGETATKSLNEMIDAAQSDCILYLGDDDWDEPEKAEVVYEGLQSYDIFLVGYNAVNIMGAQFATCFPMPSYEVEKHMSKGANYLNMAGGWRRSKCARFNEELEHISDYAWWLESFRMGATYGTENRVLSNIRNWDGQLSSTPREKWEQEHEIFSRTYGLTLNR